jgi:hypothetical protein
MQISKLGSLLVWTVAAGADRMTGAAILFHQRFAQLHALFGLGELGFRNSKASKTVSGPDQGRIEEQSRPKIGDGVIFAVLRFVDVSWLL